MRSAICMTSFTSLLWLTMIGPLQAAVTLSVAAGIELLAVNGELYTQGEGSSGDPLRLPEGVNQLLLQYGGEIRVAGNARDYARSDVFVLRFEANDQPLLLQVPPLQRQRDLERFNRAPSWILTSRSAERVPTQSAALRKEGLQLNRDYLAELAAFNRGSSLAALPSVAAVPRMRAAEQGASSLAALNAEHPEAGELLPRLIHAYQQADPQTQDLFRRWLENSRAAAAE